MIPRFLIAALLLTAPLHAEESNWWNKEWTQRQKLTIATGSDAANLSEGVDGSAVLVRLHDGNFQFTAASPDGSDLRFVADDGTVLPHHVESYDSLVNAAFVWVRVPKIAAGTQTTLNLYYGNANPGSVPPLKTTDVYDGSLVYHFADRGSNPADATANGNNGIAPLAASDGALIASAARLLGGDPVTIIASPSLDWSGSFTWSAWLKPSALQANAVVFSRGEGFRLSLDQGVPVVETGSQRSGPGQPVAPAVWTHVTVTVGDGKVSLYVNGEPYSQLQAAVTAEGPLVLGGYADAPRFVGEIDELQISKGARSASWIKFAAVSQGPSDAGQRTVALGEVEGGEGGEGHSQALEHVMLFGDIAKNMMFDGWIAIGLCVIMIIVGWTVAIQKFNYLNSIQRGTRVFLEKWEELSADLTAIDHADPASIGHQSDDRTQALIRKSPLYQIYHIGSKEIQHRLDRDKDRTKGLSGRSIHAVRAALDRGLVRETHRLTRGLVYLTISIAGGPYVGLLGTVVGVMITFAIIAKSGEVDVNSIAPGIASALLATVAGLVVAIPALFIYSYLNSRIKETTSDMHVFIDEFVAKMAEFYPPAGEASPYAPAVSSSTDH